jgi:hypothetical protein
MKLRSDKELQFWREAARIGLTGVAEIEIGERGITAAYCAALALIRLACVGETVAAGTLRENRLNPH